MVGYAKWDYERKGRIYAEKNCGKYIQKDRTPAA